MTLADAKALRDEIRARGTHAIVPLGYGPTGYFARTFRSATETLDWFSRAAWRLHQATHLRESRRFVSEQAALVTARRRSPMERMIDAACGR